MSISYCVCLIRNTGPEPDDWGIFVLAPDGKLRLVTRGFDTDNTAVAAAVRHLKGWLEQDARAGHSI